MNSGTYLTSGGFKLESLLKLSDTKSKNENTTLLHYLASLVQKKIPEITNFWEDFPHVNAASQVSVDVIFNELTSLSQFLTKFQVELTSMTPQDQENDPLFYSMISKFLVVLKQHVEESNEKMKEMANSYKEISTYFCEENTNEKFAKAFFTTLQAFAVAFEKANKEVEESKFGTIRKSRRSSYSSLR